MAYENYHYTEEFKEEAVRLIREKDYSVSAVSKRLGVTPHSLYKWLGGKRAINQEKSNDDLKAENQRLKAELKRAEEERDILKKAAAYFANESQ